MPSLHFRTRRFGLLSPLVPLTLLAGILTTGMMPVQAQELEPRLFTNVPVGMNFAILGYAYSRGNVLMDPSIPIEDLDSKLHTFA